MSEPAPGFSKHPDYEVRITPTDDHVRVLAGDTVIADTRQPLKVTETRHHPVWYVPLADVADGQISRTTHTSYCPFKGHASYWNVQTGNGVLENVLWGYLEPYTECLPLADHVAFYTDRVTLEINGATLPSQGPGWTG
ncbi:MAG: DUF427 domain-containing protein [Pseudomonadales bacterium]|jgi:uncharacterized protein (DUF427 family)